MKIEDKKLQQNTFAFRPCAELPKKEGGGLIRGENERMFEKISHKQDCCNNFDVVPEDATGDENGNNIDDLISSGLDVEEASNK